MRRKTRWRRLVVEGLKLLLLLVVFSALQEQILGIRYDLYGSRVGRAEGREDEDIGRVRAAVESTLQECAYEISLARGDLERSLTHLTDGREDLARLIDDRTRQLEATLLKKIDLERTAIDQSRAVLEEEVARRQAAPERDPQEMKRRMVYPTVQLKGNGTVGSGVIVYSEPQPELAKGGEAIHGTFILTAYHVVLEVLGDKVDTGVLEEVHILSSPRTEEMEVHAAKLVLFDRARDVAVLRVNTTRRVEWVADFFDPQAIRELDVFSRAYAVGCPLGNRPLPSLGEISSKSKVVSGQVFWMLNAPTFFGNSGGGVFQAESFRLIGISSMIYTYGKTNPAVVPHLGLFVPVSTIDEWLEGEGFGFLRRRGPIPRELLWKLAYRGEGSQGPREAVDRASAER